MSEDQGRNAPDFDRIRSLLAKSGYSQRGLAREIGVNERMVRYWISGREPAPHMLVLALERLIATRPPIATAAPALEEAFLQHSRAREHLAELESALEIYNASKALAFHPVIEDGIIIAEPAALNPPPPYGRLAIIVGECVNALQTALDYAAWQLARKWSNGGTPPNARNIYFRNPDALNAVPGASAAAISQIRACLADSRLDDLRHLVTGNKHQTLRFTTARIKPRGPWRILVYDKEVEVLEPVARIPAPKPPEAYPEMPLVSSISGEFYVELMFLETFPGRATQFEVVQTLRAIIDCVADALRSLEPFF